MIAILDKLQKVLGVCMQLFEPIVVKGCSDVRAEIQKIIDLYALKSDMVNFDILGIATLHRGEKKKDFSLLQEDERNAILGDDGVYEKNDFEIKQVYDVLLRAIKNDELMPFVTLHIDSMCYEMSLELKAGITIGEDDIFFNKLYEEITRQKVRQNIIVRIFGEQIKTEINYLKDLFSHLGIQGKLEETRRVVIGRCNGFMPEIHANFRFLLQEEWNKESGQSVDFASYAAKNGELVGISVKPQAGASGRNLKGEYIPMQKRGDSEGGENKELGAVKIRFKDGEFREEEKESGIEYYVLQDGFVSMGEGELRIITDMNFPEVSLRKNGSLLGGKSRGFVLEVSCADPNQDAVGASIILEASELKIYGSVAENAQIIANKAEINGQTHQSSLIRANELNIDIHKGKAFGEKIHINRFELGEVCGEEIFIEQANGGTIFGRAIHINALHSHTKISLSQELCIKSMNGGGNRFCITSRASFKAQEEVAYAEKKIDSNIKEMNTMLAVFNKDLALVRKTKPVVEKIKKIMEENKRSNKPNERNITESMAQYVILLRRTKYLKERLLYLQNESRELQSKLENLEAQTQEAKIKSEGKWIQENEFVYECHFPESKDILILTEGEEVDIGIDKENHKLVRETRQ